jgi:hypothetical protein
MAVKLVFEIPHEPGSEPERIFTGERMWVEIVEVLGGQYNGVLASQPVVFDLKLGHTINFGPEHICGLLKNDG